MIEMFLFLEAGADPERDRTTQDFGEGEALLVWVPDGAAAARVAAEEVAAGIKLIELYRGFDLVAAGQVIEAVAGRAAVGVAGFVLGGAPAGPVRDTATVFVGHAGANPDLHRVVREHGNGRRTTAVAVPDSAAAVAVARDLVDRGTELIEVCGGASLTAAREVAVALAGRASVSLVSWPADSLQRAAAFQAEFDAEHA